MPTSSPYESRDDKALIGLAQDHIESLAADGEASFNVNKTVLTDIDAELQRRHPEGGGFPVQRTRAEIAMALRNYRAAIELWTGLPFETDDQRHAARFEIAVCHRRLGNVFEAKEALDAVKGVMTTKVRYKNEVWRVSEATARFASAHLSSTAFEKIEEGKLQDAKALMRAAAVLRHQPQVEQDLLEETLGRLMRFAADEELPPAAANADETADLRPAVLICGFGWSGSGAVADCIRSSKTVHFPFGDTEVSLFEGIPKSADGVVQLLELARTGSREAFRSSIVSFVAGPILGLAFQVAGNAVTQQLYRKSLARFIAEAPGEAHAAIQTFLSDTDRASRDGVDNAAFRQALRRFLRLVVGRKDGRIAVLNNCIHAYSLECLDLFDDAKAVCVIRDPRDQYVARVRENWSRRIKLSRFMALTTQHMEQYGKALEDAATRDRVMTVRFEDFVGSEAARAVVMEYCGLPPAEQGVFDPSKSIRNVGIFRSFEKPKDIRKIEEAFPELLTGI